MPKLLSKKKQKSPFAITSFSQLLDTIYSLDKTMKLAIVILVMLLLTTPFIISSVQTLLFYAATK